jgi:hypothetical protein
MVNALIGAAAWDLAQQLVVGMLGEPGMIEAIRLKYSWRAYDKIVQAPAPVKAIARGKLSYAALSYIMITRLSDGERGIPRRRPLTLGIETRRPISSREEPD